MYTSKGTSVKYYSTYTDANGVRHHTINTYKYSDQTIERMRDLTFEKSKSNVNFG